jgi:AbrB family looped-hinge helix DNA binding protein
VARITSKLQVTIPKAIADRYGLSPGDDIDFVPAGDVIRVIPAAEAAPGARGDAGERLRLFDKATARQGRRQRGRPRGQGRSGRGWTREELYERGGAG